MKQHALIGWIFKLNTFQIQCKIQYIQGLLTKETTDKKNTTTKGLKHEIISATFSEFGMDETPKHNFTLEACDFFAERRI